MLTGHAAIFAGIIMCTCRSSISSMHASCIAIDVFVGSNIYAPSMLARYFWVLL